MIASNRPWRTSAPWCAQHAPHGRGSPFATVARVRTPRRATASLLLSVSRFLEGQAAALGELAVVIASFERATSFTSATRRRYRDLARSAAFVGVLGAGMPVEPEPGVRGAALAAGDPVAREWDVAVVGPHFAAALVARDLDGAPGDPDRTFDYVLTHDRPLVLDVARSLLARTVPRAVDDGVGSLMSSVGVVSVGDS